MRPVSGGFLLLTARRNLERLRLSDAVVVATVVSRGAAPAAWSGTITLRQSVTYTVEEVLKGPLKPRSSLTLQHLVVARSKTAAPQPGLRHDWFAEGVSLVLFLEARPNGWEALDENRGVAPADSDLIDALRDQE